MQKKTIKFEIQDMLPIGLTLVVVGIALAYGLEVIGDSQDDIGESVCARRTDDYTAYSESQNLCLNASDTSATGIAPGEQAFNSTGDAITGVGEIPSKMPTIAKVIVAAIIIGILVRYLVVRYA